MVAISNITGHTTIHFTHSQDQFSRIIPFCPIPKAMYPLDRLLGRPLGGVSTQFVRCWWRHRLHRSFRPNEYNSRARTVCQSHAQLLLGWETIPDYGRVQNDPPGRRDVCDYTWFQLDIYWQITQSRSHILGRRIGVALGKDRYLSSRLWRQMILRMTSNMHIGFLVKQRPLLSIFSILSFCCLSVWRRHSVFKCYLI